MAKTKLNDEVSKKLCVAHENGLSVTACAEGVGINPRTLYNWLKKGETAKSGRFKKFYENLTKSKIQIQNIPSPKY